MIFETLPYLQLGESCGNLFILLTMPNNMLLIIYCSSYTIFSITTLALGCCFLCCNVHHNISKLLWRKYFYYNNFTKYWCNNKLVPTLCVPCPRAHNHPGGCSAQCNSLSSEATCEHLFVELLKLELITCYVVLKWYMVSERQCISNACNIAICNVLLF